MVCGKVVVAKVSIILGVGFVFILILSKLIICGWFLTELTSSTASLRVSSSIWGSHLMTPLTSLSQWGMAVVILTLLMCVILFKVS